MKDGGQSLARFLSPRAICVVGGGTWCAAVVKQCRDSGFDGPIWVVHPTRTEVAGVAAFPSVDDLPGVPDAAFIGVNRVLTVKVAAELSALGCSGAVCFAAGFAEALAEMADGAELQAELVQAAGQMRVLGPNCYGMVNMLDGVALWPDLHGMVRVESGVAVVGQSSNVLINLTMQRRGLPLACVVAAGNQAQTSMAEIGMALLDDPRITALGLHIEGINDLAPFEALARHAHAVNKPIVALKVGQSEQAQAAVVSHTASLVGSATGARALLKRLGIAQVDSASELLEVLKLMHVTGGLPEATVASASCSGGEASLMADLGEVCGLRFPSLETAQREGLRAALGPRVALANPLDYNTYIWGDEDALARCYAALCRGPQALTCVVLDLPRDDRFPGPDYRLVLSALRRAKAETGAQVAVISLLAEGLPEDVAADLIADGIVPFHGMGDAIRAIRAGVRHAPDPTPLLLPRPEIATRTLTEAEAKVMLAEAGLRVPQAARADLADVAAVASRIGFPVVLKGEGIAHKTEAGAVRLNLTDAASVTQAAEAMPCTSFLVEEMVTGTVAELLLGVTHDPAHGFVLTLGLGGTWTELMGDTASVLVPASRAAVQQALMSLRCAPLLTGYRGRPGADVNAILDAAMGLQQLVTEQADSLREIEINPLICLPDGAVVADALVRTGETG